MAAPVAAVAAPTPTPPPTLAPPKAPSVVLSTRPAPSPGLGLLAGPSPITSPSATASPQASAARASSPTASVTEGAAVQGTQVPGIASGDEQVDDALDTTDEIDPAVDWQAFVPTDTADHLAAMDRAARESGCGVPWQLLAAIARVESDFGRNMATSSAGAVGYGQFLPSSWGAFGSDGNVYDYRDALPAIAHYLCQAGLERDPRAALFAYNHADWYVDLVLGLAVKYDRMAPGAPTPAVLGVGPAQEPGVPLQYAAGRDVHLQGRTRSVDGGVRWLGVPWSGRTPGHPISAEALEITVLSMLRSAFGVGGDVPSVRDAASSENLGAVAASAWDAGLLALPGATTRWTLAEVRQQLRMTHPVIVFVGSQGLPGHPSDEADGEQPLVLIGTTSDGFVYSDPTFASSLGYGLQMNEADLMTYWDAAARPGQALAFVPKPRPPARQAHVGLAEPPEAIARLVSTATPVPEPVAAPAAPPTETPRRTAAALPTVLAVARAGVDHRDDADSSLPVVIAIGLAGVALRWLRVRSPT